MEIKEIKDIEEEIVIKESAFNISLGMDKPDNVIILTPTGIIL